MKGRCRFLGAAIVLSSIICLSSAATDSALAAPILEQTETTQRTALPPKLSQPMPADSGQMRWAAPVPPVATAAPAAEHVLARACDNFLGDCGGVIVGFADRAGRTVRDLQHNLLERGPVEWFGLKEDLAFGCGGPLMCVSAVTVAPGFAMPDRTPDLRSASGGGGGSHEATFMLHSARGAGLGSRIVYGAADYATRTFAALRRPAFWIIPAIAVGALSVLLMVVRVRRLGRAR